MLCRVDSISVNPLFFFPFQSLIRSQFSASQHHHLRRAQHRHAHRQRLHRHPASAQRTPGRGDGVHQRPAALLHPEPHGSRHPPASLHRGAAVHRCGATGCLCLLPCLLLCRSGFGQKPLSVEWLPYRAYFLPHLFFLFPGQVGLGWCSIHQKGFVIPLLDGCCSASHGNPVS